MARDVGMPVAMVPVRVVIHGTKHAANARKPADFLLSEQTELALSRSTARQIPLGPVDESQLSDEVRQLKEWAADGYDLNHPADAHRDCLAWLKTEYLE